MYSHSYLSTPSSASTSILSSGDAGVWTIIAAVLALVGGILTYILFLKGKTTYNNKFVLWLKDFLDFKKMTLEVILKVTYIIFALFITLASFGLIGTSFVGFLLSLVFGNLFVRIGYETAILLLMIFKNTSEINKKLGDKK